MGCLCFCKNDIHPDRKECGFTKEWAPREPSDSEEEQERDAYIFKHIPVVYNIFISILVLCHKK